MIQYLGPRDKPKSKLPPVFTTTGTLGTDYLYHESTNSDGLVYFEMAILNDCYFNFSRIVPIDLVLVGAGENGKSGKLSDLNGYVDDYGGDGGDGAKILRLMNGVSIQPGVDFLLRIGKDGSDTTAFGYTSSNGENNTRKGGRGARSYGNAFGQSYDADPGVDGEYIFIQNTSSLFPYRKFGPSGGGAGVKNRTYYVPKSSASGGDDGGGHGGTESNPTGTPGADNSGAGAGGGYTYSTTNTGAKGGSGIIVFRSHIYTI